MNATDFATKFCTDGSQLVTRNFFVKCRCTVGRVSVVMFRRAMKKSVRTFRGTPGVPGSAEFETRTVFEKSIAPVEENEVFEHFRNRACFGCGAVFTSKEIGRTHNPDHKCNARCLNAKSGDCECSCGGENHGKKWA